MIEGWEKSGEELADSSIVGKNYVVAHVQSFYDARLNRFLSTARFAAISAAVRARE